MKYNLVFEGGRLPDVFRGNNTMWYGKNSHNEQRAGS